MILTDLHAFGASDAADGIVPQERALGKAFGVVAPPAAQIAAGQKYGGADSRAHRAAKSPEG